MNVRGGQKMCERGEGEVMCERGERCNVREGREMESERGGEREAKHFNTSAF